MKQTVDVIIPSYNGKYLLEKHLAEVINNTDFLNEVIVVDNGSTDGTVTWLKQNFPKVKIIENRTNLVFTKPVNQGVAISKADFIVLLNNDVRPTKGYLKSPLNYFKEKKVFAVSFNESGSSWPKVYWDGKIQYLQGEEKNTPRFSAWASGGSAIFRRSIWNDIGGFNEIYAPFYWEDIDICYRAWKMGYSTVWDNSSLVYHEHESTTKKLNIKYVNLIKQRNELLFNWINITDKNLVLNHKKYLLSYTIKHPGYLKIIISALIRFYSNQHHPIFVLTDKEVLASVNKKYE